MSNHPPNAKGDDRINVMKLYVFVRVNVCEFVFWEGVGGGGGVVGDLSDTQHEKKAKGLNTRHLLENLQNIAWTYTLFFFHSKTRNRILQLCIYSHQTAALKRAPAF